MSKFTQTLQVRWSDIDANRHLRHSVYYDCAASLRMTLLSERGLTTKKLEELMIGPVLFREEAVFRREFLFEDTIMLDVELKKATADFSRWTLQHHFTKADGTLCCTLTVDGAWIDMTKRKLAVPNEYVQEIFKNFPKASDFELITLEKKA